MPIEGAAPSLRETLEQNFAQVVEQEQPATGSAEQTGSAATPAAAAPPAASSSAPADRPRDDKGRFVPGSPEDKAQKAAEQAQAAASAAPAISRPAVPKSWKHDYHSHWEKIDPQLAAYIAQREDEAAAGIGKHRGEVERLQPLARAIEPFLPDLQQHGIDPAQFISNLGNAHKTLALGSPEQKLAMFASLAQQYQVPLQHLFVQGQDGRLYLNQQLQAAMPAQPQQQPPDVRKVVQEALLEQQTAQEIAAFEAQQEKYPHYAKVKADMALILQSGRANDLPSAYNMAIRLHDDVWEAEQARKREADELSRREAQDKAAKEAKARALSPRSSTPSATLATGNSGGSKSVRAALEANAHLLDGANARV